MAFELRTLEQAAAWFAAAGFYGRVRGLGTQKVLCVGMQRGRAGGIRRLHHVVFLQFRCGGWETSDMVTQQSRRFGSLLEAAADVRQRMEERREGTPPG